MALIHADFPSGQQGLYGTSIAQVANFGWTGDNTGNGATFDLVADPDPSIGALGVVFRCSTFNLFHPALRYSNPLGAQAISGMAFKLWSDRLPYDETGSSAQWWFKNISNATIVEFKIRPDGSISAYNSAGTILGTTLTPVLTPNAYYLIETKVLRDAAAGTIEVRVNGLPVLELDTLALGADNIAILAIGCDAGNPIHPNAVNHFKDVVFWDGTGSAVNDFIGNVFPHDLYVNEDDDFNWETSRTGGGGEGFDLIADHKPYNLLSKSGTPDPRINDNDTISIAGTYYRWTSGTVDPGGEAGTSANPWRVALGADDAEAFANMAAAINLTGTPGTTYSTGLVAANSACIAVNWTGSVLQIEPIDGATRAIAVTETGANLAWSNASTFPIGPTDTSFIEAGFTSAVKATGTVTFSGIPVADQEVVIGAQTYAAKALRGGAGEFTIGGDAAATATNLITAVGLDSTDVTASSGGAGIVDIEAVAAGAAGNSLALTTNATNTAVSGSGTLEDGADTLYPTPSKFRLTKLPPDITTVRAVMDINRMMKTDGGDCNLTSSLSPDDTNWFDGADRPATVAFTFWKDISYVSPATSAPWTPAEIDNLYKKVDRTL